MTEEAGQTGAAVAEAPAGESGMPQASTTTSTNGPQALSARDRQAIAALRSAGVEVEEGRNQPAAEEPAPEAQRDEHGRFKAKDAPGSTNEPEPTPNPEPRAEERQEAGKEPGKGLDERHARMARHLGYAEEDIAEMDPAVYDEVIENAAAQLSRKFNDRASAEPTKPAAKPVAPNGEESLALTEEQLQSPFDEFEDSATQLAKFNAMRAELTSLREWVTEAKAERVKSQDAAKAREEDQFFQGIAKDYPQYGDRPLSDYAKDADEAQLRARVQKRANALQAGWRAEYGEELSRRDALDLALNQLHKDDIREQARKQVLKVIQERRRSAMPHPGARKGAQPAAGLSEELLNRRDRIARETGIHIPDRD